MTERERKDQKNESENKVGRIEKDSYIIERDSVRFREEVEGERERDRVRDSERERKKERKKEDNLTKCALVEAFLLTLLHSVLHRSPCRVWPWRSRLRLKKSYHGYLLLEVRMTVTV